MRAQVISFGRVFREDDQITLCRGGWCNGCWQVDLKMAIQSYGSMLPRYRSMPILSWIGLIRKQYASSPKRDRLIRALLLTARPDNKPPKNPKFYTGN